MTSDDEATCGELWAIAGTDSWKDLETVVPALAHPRPKVRRFASIAVKSLCPTAGLPRAPGVGRSDETPDTSLQDAGPMSEWLLPREAFRRAIKAVLFDPRANHVQLASSLARLPGEFELVRDCLREHAATEIADSYERQWQQAARVPEQLIVALTYRCNRSCPYCYAYESQDEVRGDIDLAHAREVLDWGVARNIRLVSFTGGEPTCHPDFPALVDAVAERGMRLYLNTNGLFGRRVLDALHGPFLVDVGFHVSAPELHRKNELASIERNVCELRARGVDVFVRFTLSRETEGALPWLMAFCERLGIHHLNLALAFPGRSATNAFLPSERFLAAKPALLTAFALAQAHGVRVRTSKPIPLCLFTHREFATLQRFHLLTSTCTVHRRGGVHNLVVNPDLSTYPCVGLPFRGPRLTDSPDYSPQATHCQSRIRRALRIVQSGCESCALYPTGICQASCLGHCNEPAQRGGELVA